MSVFIDTSAFLAFLLSNDINFKNASNKWDNLLDNEDDLVTSNYVIVETCSLLQKRTDMKIVSVFLDNVIPSLMIYWINSTTHLLSTEALSQGTKSGPSLVDHSSFILMRKSSVKKVFTYDKHFKSQGFEIVS